MLNSILLQGITVVSGAANQVVDTAKNLAVQASQLPVPATTEPAKQASLSLLDLIVKGGLIMIPMGLLSIITLYFFF